jgi:hypothetical protein
LGGGKGADLIAASGASTYVFVGFDGSYWADLANPAG